MEPPTTEQGSILEFLFGGWKFRRGYIPRPRRQTSGGEGGGGGREEGAENFELQMIGVSYLMMNFLCFNNSISS